MELEIRNEDLDICRECGGMCCIKCGCDYAASDFSERTYNAFLKSLSEGDKSIVAMMKFKTLSNGKFIAQPILYIRARNVNRDIVDLVSMKTRCASLLETGCCHDYEHRPFGGKNLKPVKSDEGPCKPIVSPLSILESWEPYQKQLGKIVKHYTGKNVFDKISEDVENLFYRCLTNDYRGVAYAEYMDLKGFILLLIKAYPCEYQRANERYKKSSFSRVLNKK